LYWTIPEDGIYRIDLADLGGEYLSLSSFKILNGNIASFVINVQDYCLYFANSTSNSLMSSFLDGANSHEIHDEIQNGYLQNVNSLVQYGGLFYWKDGNTGRLMREEYHDSMYFHNEVFIVDDSTSDEPMSGLVLWHPSIQLTPG